MFNRMRMAGVIDYVTKTFGGSAYKLVLTVVVGDMSVTSTSPGTTYGDGVAESACLHSTDWAELYATHTKMAVEFSDGTVMLPDGANLTSAKACNVTPLVTNLATPTVAGTSWNVWWHHENTGSDLTGGDYSFFGFDGATGGLMVSDASARRLFTTTGHSQGSGWAKLWVAP